MNQMSKTIPKGLRRFGLIWTKFGPFGQGFQCWHVKLEFYVLPNESKRPTQSKMGKRFGLIWTNLGPFGQGFKS